MNVGEGKLAKVRVMYWKEIPIQVQAEDESGIVSRPLDSRFQEGADSIALFDKSIGTDEYLDAWEWHEYGELEGSAKDTAISVVERFNSGFPMDFVARIRDSEARGDRIPQPGAVNHWMLG